MHTHKDTLNLATSHPSSEELGTPLKILPFLSSYTPHEIANERVCHKTLLLSQNLSDHTYTQEMENMQNKASPGITITPESPRGIKDLVYRVQASEILLREIPGKDPQTREK